MKTANKTLSSFFSNVSQAIRMKLKKVLTVGILCGLSVLLLYTFVFTPFPVYILDYLNLRPFFLPNIMCNRCNNFTYDYIIKNDKACKDDVYLLIIVASYHANVNARQAIRKTWGGNMTYRGLQIKTLFAFGIHQDKNFQRQLFYEQDMYGDIIQGNFSDFYRSLTNKSMMALEWVTEYCPKAEYVLKTDDDGFNVPQRYVDHLLHIRTSHFIGGYCFTVMPDRSPSSKFYISLDNYPDRYYPTYCSGPGYVLSQSAVQAIVKTAPDVVFLHMEDVFVSGVVRVAAHIHYTQIEGIVISTDQMTKCALATWAKNSHNIVPERQLMLWQERVVPADRDKDCSSRNNLILVMAVLVLSCWIKHMVTLIRLR